jgi:thioesterase domain-containing protein
MSIAIEAEVRAGTPRDALEWRLVQIWEELLDRRPVGVHDDFFELGGDSVLAMSLLARVIQETGHPLPSGGIFSAPTIERLALALRTQSVPSEWSPLVPLRTEGWRRPFFCVHPGGGNVLCYLQLSRQLGPDQPFYGLQAPGVDGIRDPLTTISEMAREYIAAVRTVFPHGPYALGGWSVGGVIAYEMAQQLLAAGQQVQPLVILDSGVLYACAIVTALFPKGQPGALDLLRQPSADQISTFRARSAAARLVPEEADEQMAWLIYRLFTGNMMAVLNYRPQPYPGQIHLFQASQPIVRERFQPDAEWRRLCEDVQLHMVPGDHLAMLHEPHVQELADRLGRCLAESL